MLESFGKNRWKIPGSNGMSVEPVVYANDEILNEIEDQSLEQLKNASRLRGVRYVGGMPDLHVGYGVPVGCVMAMDAKDGLISAGAVGMDVNCGMRLLVSSLKSSEVPQSEIKNLSRQIANIIPLGIGTTSPHQDKLKDHIRDILLEGVKALRNLGYAREDDLKRIQDGGCFEGARLDAIPKEAWNRLDQLSTLGGGNHFIEIDAVDQIFEDSVAESYGLRRGRLTVMIHTGSRGFGHQICTDYSSLMLEKADSFGLRFPDQELASAPVESEPGRKYYGAMASAANLAYSNRQMIAYDIRKVFSNLIDKSPSSLKTVYDITHNLARRERINGHEIVSHRKGAIRGLPPQHPETPLAYEDVGHPIIVPGNMASGAYVLRATPAVKETWYTVNHGAGRKMSRRQANESFSTEVFRESMQDVVLLGTAHDKLLDESPPAYKGLDPVIDTLVDIGIVEKVARLKPRAVIKGG